MTKKDPTVLELANENLFKFLTQRRITKELAISSKEILEADEEELKAKMSDKQNYSDKVQYLFKFPNGYGASVVQGQHTYGGKEGLWELAVLKYSKDGKWELDYTTLVTDDVVGNLTDEEVEGYLEDIRGLERAVEK